MSFYRQQLLGHQGLCEDNHARLSQETHQPWPPLFSQEGGCSRLSAINQKNTDFCEKPVLQVSLSLNLVVIVSHIKIYIWSEMNYCYFKLNIAMMR